MLMLEGIKVLDLTQYLAGPTIGRLMAEMGAEVIKVEFAPTGDPSRGLPIADSGRSGYFIQQNRGKKSIALDLKQDKSVDILRELIKKVDVVVENFGPGVMEKKNLSWPEVQAINPAVIMASVSAYGRESTLSHKTGFDWAAQAFSGLMHMIGERDGRPLAVVEDRNGVFHAIGLDDGLNVTVNQATGGAKTDLNGYTLTAVSTTGALSPKLDEATITALKALVA